MFSLYSGSDTHSSGSLDPNANKLKEICTEQEKEIDFLKNRIQVCLIL
jgi:hypothetical protein